MTLGVSIPQQPYKFGTPGPGSSGQGTLAHSGATVTVTCGVLTADNVIQVIQSEPSASQTVGLIEQKYSSLGALKRGIGNEGTFVLSAADGAQQTNDVKFDWYVLSSKAI